jgi:hypothetical protein
MYPTSHRQYCEAVLFMLIVMCPSDDGLGAESCQGYIRINKLHVLVTLDGPNNLYTCDFWTLSIVQ